jgi:hypothetical protein
MNDYPPEFDEENLTNEYFREAFPEYESVADLARAAYKWTDCGPSISAVVDHNDAGEYVQRTIHCSELPSLGTWQDMDKSGTLLLALCISSIVEGVEETTETIIVSASQLDEDPADFERRFWEAIDDVGAQASIIWDRTHGCDECARLWHQRGVFESEYGLFEGADGATPVCNECPNCEGAGIPI